MQYRPRPMVGEHARVLLSGPVMLGCEWVVAFESIFYTELDRLILC